MNKVTVTTNGIIFFDSTHIGSVAQTSEGTIVRDCHGKHVAMPYVRYALSCGRPASGLPGRADFERDLWDALGGHV